MVSVRYFARTFNNFIVETEGRYGNGSVWIKLLESKCGLLNCSIHCWPQQGWTWSYNFVQPISSEWRTLIVYIYRVIFVQSTVHIKFNASVSFNICFRILQTALKQQIKRLFKPSEQSACIKNDRLPNNDITHVLRLCNFLVHCKWHGISQNLTKHRDTQMEMTYSNQIVFYKRH